MSKIYVLRIYSNSAKTIIRETEHKTRAAALKSRDNYERRHGRAPHAIDAVTVGRIIK